MLGIAEQSAAPSFRIGLPTPVQRHPLPVRCCRSSSAHALQKDLQANADENTTADDPSRFFRAVRQLGAQKPAQRADNEGREPDDRAGLQNVRLRKSKAHANRERIYARGNCEQKRPAVAETCALGVFRFLRLAAQYAAQHVAADEGEYEKADIWPKCHEPVAHRAREYEAQKRHQRLKNAEIERIPQRIAQPVMRVYKRFADGYGEGVRS